MYNIIAVFLGGGIGAVFRYLVGIYTANTVLAANFPATLWINIIGSLLIGIFSVLLINKSNIQQFWVLFLICGFCGGFTTFSTFSIETVNFIKSQMYVQALLYSLTSLICCILSTFIGGFIAKNFI